VHVVDVDVVGAEASERGFTGGDEVIARGAEIIGKFGRGYSAEGGLRRDEELVASAFDGSAENFFGGSVGVAVGSVEEVDAGIEAEGDEIFCFFELGGAPGFEEFVGAAESAGAEGKFRNF